MSFWTLFVAASIPIFQVIIISMLGALMATEHLNLLPEAARKYLNKIVFTVFSPSLIFANLAATLTFEDLIKWWFMPVNIALTYVFGGLLGSLAVKLLKPEARLEGLIIAACSTGNLGKLLLIVVPAICTEDASPFGDKDVCKTIGFSYVSLSMALGGFYTWTFTYQFLRVSALKYEALQAAQGVHKVPNEDLELTGVNHLLDGETDELAAVIMPLKEATESGSHSQAIEPKESANKLGEGNLLVWREAIKELLTPPAVSAIIGFLFGAVPWLKNLMIGDNAPLRVIQHSIILLGDGTIPCITLILGGNLIQGFGKAKLKPVIILAVICVRYVFLPVIGIGVVKAASGLGFLPSDPLFHYVLMIQFAIPPAMNISTITQLFNMANEESSVLLLWAYLVASFSLTLWSAVFMSILSRERNSG